MGLEVTKSEIRRLVAILGGIGLAAVLVMLGPVVPVLLMLLLPESECSDTVLERIVSPGGGTTATVSLSNCGATTPFVSEVSLRTKGRGDGDRIFAAKGDDKIDVEWNGNSELSISYRRSELIYRQMIVWNTMRISYKERQ